MTAAQLVDRINAMILAGDIKEDAPVILLSEGDESITKYSEAATAVVTFKPRDVEQDYDYGPVMDFHTINPDSDTGCLLLRGL